MEHSNGEIWRTHKQIEELALNREEHPSWLCLSGTGEKTGCEAILLVDCSALEMDNTDILQDSHGPYFLFCHGKSGCGHVRVDMGNTLKYCADFNKFNIDFEHLGGAVKLAKSIASVIDELYPGCFGPHSKALHFKFLWQRVLDHVLNTEHRPTPIGVIGFTGSEDCEKAGDGLFLYLWKRAWSTRNIHDQLEPLSQTVDVPWYQRRSDNRKPRLLTITDKRLCKIRSLCVAGDGKEEHYKATWNKIRRSERAEDNMARQERLDHLGAALRRADPTLVSFSSPGHSRSPGSTDAESSGISTPTSGCADECSLWGGHGNMPNEAEQEERWQCYDSTTWETEAGSDEVSTGLSEQRTPERLEGFGHIDGFSEHREKPTRKPKSETTIHKEIEEILLSDQSESAEGSSQNKIGSDQPASRRRSTTIDGTSGPSDQTRSTVSNDPPRPSGQGKYVNVDGGPAAFGDVIGFYGDGSPILFTRYTAAHDAARARMAPITTPRRFTKQYPFSWDR
ncbi:hypothetical protein BKA67DRAFT_656698 [Truncatella angustata]|uniref:Uncharacterized protein n=1 Tax=Truncatella angustata TaxID=152316 RepID=A0A9P8UUL0_9PEZI|nr:uncharacterized protein BKA67DRAFT_656698 [Truncatella angustata]KAH6658508.1 hypothetical protein BKA67DRAFT_656698 [Truncatella angustata]